MEHPIYRVTKFEIVGAYKLSVHFDDGVSQTINFEPVLFGEMYGPLRELALGRYLGQSPRYWVNLQSRYDMDVAEEVFGDRVAREVRPSKAVA
jgi:hypothetical protein